SRTAREGSTVAVGPTHASSKPAPLEGTGAAGASVGASVGASGAARRPAAMGSEEVDNPLLNIEYLKNTIVAYMCSSSVAERGRMLPVIALLLQLRDDEQLRIKQHLEQEGGGLVESASRSLLSSAWSMFGSAPAPAPAPTPSSHRPVR
ncbi:hypothetical protein EON66_09310, partial [archaeon]